PRSASTVAAPRVHPNGAVSGMRGRCVKAIVMLRRLVVVEDTLTMPDRGQKQVTCGSGDRRTSHDTCGDWSEGENVADARPPLASGPCRGQVRSRSDCSVASSS